VPRLGSVKRSTPADGLAATIVEKLWMTGANAVENRRTKENSSPESARVGARTRHVCHLRADLRLYPASGVVESSLARHTTFSSHRSASHVTVHHYQEEIAGRTYHIEVSAISAERWRAKLARRPGMPTALMPFYGDTPEHAARELTNWLSLVAAGPRPR
jgi:hypothetical protein